MNLYILFFVSLPEAFLNLIIILLIAGEKDRLKINNSNVIRFVVTLILMLAASWFIRPIASNFVISISLHIIAYTLIMFLIYRMNIMYALLGISFALMLIVTTEVLYFPYIITYVHHGMENFTKAYPLFLPYSLPDRIVQVIVIRFLWKHDILLATRINRRFHKLFIASFLILTIIEDVFYLIFVTFSDKMPLSYQIAFSVGLFVMAVVQSFLIIKFIYLALGGVLVKGYGKYVELEENVKFAFDEIRNLLEEKKVDDAIKLIKELKE